jgi:DnaK suppressor protein
MPLMDIAARRRRLEALRRDIQELRSERDAQTGVVKLDQTQTGRLSRMDALQRQAVAQHSAQLANARLRRIDAALRRCDQGRYGLCLDCEDPIDPRRLDADPAAERCIRCAGRAGFC